MKGVTTSLARLIIGMALMAAPAIVVGQDKMQGPELTARKVDVRKAKVNKTQVGEKAYNQSKYTKPNVKQIEVIAKKVSPTPEVGNDMEPKLGKMVQAQRSVVEIAGRKQQDATRRTPPKKQIEMRRIYKTKRAME